MSTPELLFLVDNSVLQRVHRSAEVASALVSLTRLGDFAGCLPQLLEEGYSARSAEDHTRILDAALRAKIFLPPDEGVASIAIDLQRRLFADGRGRSVGVSDLQIAATAIRHTDDRRRVTVVHYDGDFEHVAGVAPDFRHRWIVPRGTIA